MEAQSHRKRRRKLGQRLNKCAERQGWTFAGQEVEITEVIRSVDEGQSRKSQRSSDRQTNAVINA